MPSPERSAALPESAAADSRPPLHVVKASGRPALSALEREFLAPLLEIQETPPSPGQRKLLWTLIALTTCVVSWACFGRISIVSTAPGKIIPDGRVKELQALETSVVKAIHVREGQHVQKDELLLELDPAISSAQMQADRDKYEFNRLEQARLLAELTHAKIDYTPSGRSSDRLSLEEQIRSARERAYSAKRDQARAAVEEKTQALAAALATLQKFRETSSIARERESAAQPLVATGAISKLDYLQLKQDLAESQNDFAAQLKTVEQARAAVTEAEKSAAQVARDRTVDIFNDLDQRVTSEPALKGDFDKSKELLGLKWLRAPVSGVIQKVDPTTIGQVVPSTQTLITIVPDGTPLIVEATVTNQDIGYLQVGQPAEIKVDTFPFQKYGSLSGTLIWVSADAEDKDSASHDLDIRSGLPQKDDGRNAQSNSNAGFVYKIHVRMNRTQFIVDGTARNIRAGMTVQADVVTDRRRVIEFFLSPVIKYLDEGLKVR